MKRMIFFALMLLTVIISLPAQENGEPMSPVLPIILNTVPGLGVGSYVQGDSLGGTILLVVDIVGYGTLGTCFLAVMINALGSFMTFQFTDMWEESTVFRIALITGLCIYIANRVFGIIRPIWYHAMPDNGNDEDNIAFGIEPALRPTRDGTSCAFGVTLKVTGPLN